MNILFICTGNTCRSPMAEALMKSKMPGAAVRSAGIFAGENEPANPLAMKTLEKKRITSNHLSQPVTQSLLEWADVVLVMTTQHKQVLIVNFPDFQNKYFTLKEYVSEADKEVWDTLKKSYASLEKKRALFIQNNPNITSEALTEAINKHLENDIIKINQLEKELGSYDISDPFGGDLLIYEKTMHELETYIDLLIKKIKK
ncbi:low molecular weight protein arginine phosphatase [Virgibacillus sp. W0181]|uniref:low molecular weight protein arginine phosphatase n=1 Tax=Virgibacillus sp. W0181 TaxID=3391581 RepID=UPI003F45092F